MLLVGGAMNKKVRDMYVSMFGDKIMKQIVVVPESERFIDEFKEPTAYFIVNALGDALFFKTRSRSKAQDMVDSMYGKGFYIIKKAMKAAVR